MDNNDLQLNKIFLEKLLGYIGNYDIIEEEFMDFFMKNKKVSFTKFNRIQASGDIKKCGLDLNKGNLASFMFSKLNKVIWLDRETKENIYNYVLNYYKKSDKLDIYGCIKLYIILLSIPYAEQFQDQNGTINNYLYEHKIKFKDILMLYLEDSSYGIWQIPIPHLKEIYNNEQRKNFYKNMTFENQLDIVTDILVNRIGLEEDLDAIFSKYNHSNFDNTGVSVVQLFINQLKLIAYDIIKNWNNDNIEFYENLFEQNLNQILHLNSEKIPYIDLFLTIDELDKIKNCFSYVIRHFLNNKKLADLDSKKQIYNVWLSLEIDGNIKLSKNSQSYNAIKSLFEFFYINNFESLDRLTEKFNIDDVYDIFFIGSNHSLKGITLPPFVNRDLSEEFKLKEIILKNILESDIKLVSQLEDFIIKTLDISGKFDKSIKDFIYKTKGETKDSFKHKDLIICYFRRNFFQNPGFVNRYVNTGISAFWRILKD